MGPRLYRGGRPSSPDITALAEMGIRTIIDLRDWNGISVRERDQAHAHGLRYHRIPLGNLVGPTRAAIARILAILADPASGVVYVHCQRGSDRTGTVVACYRVAHEGWSAEDAIAEARDRGMFKIEFLKRLFIRRFHRARGGARVSRDGTR